MGCDIHAMIERRKVWRFTDANGELHTSWINAGDPDIERNYDVFSILADPGRNRYGQASISGNRGLPVTTYSGGSSYPNTCTEFAQSYECMGEDAHTPGYATLREMLAYPFDEQPWPAYKESIRAEWYRIIGELQRVADRYDGDPDAVRIVFFFDN